MQPLRAQQPYNLSRACERPSPQHRGGLDVAVVDAPTAAGSAIALRGAVRFSAEGLRGLDVHSLDPTGWAARAPRFASRGDLPTVTSRSWRSPADLNAFDVIDNDALTRPTSANTPRRRLRRHGGSRCPSALAVMSSTRLTPRMPASTPTPSSSSIPSSTIPESPGPAGSTSPSTIPHRAATPAPSPSSSKAATMRRKSTTPRRTRRSPTRRPPSSSPASHSSNMTSNSRSRST